MSYWHKYKISKGKAIDLQEWALTESRTKEFLDSLPELPKKGKIKPGLYVNYGLDESEFDGGMDYPDIGIVNVYAVLEDKEEIWLGEVRAYNFETYWLSTTKDIKKFNFLEFGKLIKSNYSVTLILFKDATIARIIKENTLKYFKMKKDND